MIILKLLKKVALYGALTLSAYALQAEPFSWQTGLPGFDRVSADWQARPKQLFNCFGQTQHHFAGLDLTFDNGFDVYAVEQAYAALSCVKGVTPLEKPIYVNGRQVAKNVYGVAIHLTADAYEQLSRTLARAGLAVCIAREQCLLRINRD